MNLTNKNGFASLIHHRQFNAELGGLVGLLVGGAVGVPYEFHSPEQIPPRDQIEMTTPVGWSDDGSQTLCLLATSGHQSVRAHEQHFHDRT
jgi:ADP-ribosyl-[dinitrogen reductase] hydrolase